MTTTRAPLRARWTRRPRSRRAFLLLALLASAFCKRGTPPAPAGDAPVAPASRDAAAEPGEVAVPSAESPAEPPGEPVDPKEELTARTYDVLLQDSTVYRGTTAGIVIEEAAQPEQPRRLGVLVLPGSVADLAWVGRVQPPRPAECPPRPGGSPGCPVPPPVTLVAAAAGPAGVFLVDVGDPEHPAVVGRFDTAGAAVRLAVELPLLWVADGAGGIVALDVSDPASPRAVGGVAEPPPEEEQAAESATTPEAGVPAAPDARPGAFYVRDLVRFGDRLFAAAGSRGVVVYDVRKSAGVPSLEPLLVLDTPGDARALAVDGDRVWVADGPSGLQVLDTALHRPDEAPGIVLSYPTRDVCRDVKLDVSRDKSLFPPVAYLAVGDRGLEILDVSDLATVAPLGRHVPPRPVNRVTLGPNGLLLLANDSAGLMIVDAVDPTAVRQIFPAP